MKNELRKIIAKKMLQNRLLKSKSMDDYGDEIFAKNSSHYSGNVAKVSKHHLKHLYDNKDSGFYTETGPGLFIKDMEEAERKGKFKLDTRRIDPRK